MGKVNPANFNADDLRTTQWVGIVEDTEDDIFEGRCKIRVYGKMDDRVDPEDPESAYKLPTAALPFEKHTAKVIAHGIVPTIIALYAPRFFCLNFFIILLKFYRTSYGVH